VHILITGSGGLIGSSVRAAAEAAENKVSVLKRNHGRSESFWEPLPDQPIDAVVHLAGENIAAKRWYPAHKKLIRSSRVERTRLLCERLTALSRRPSVLICASAVGYYGHRGDEELNEDSAPGDGFLAEVCRDWESACSPAIEAGIRTVNLRTGMVLAPKGGALARLRPLFKAGMGGKLGHGSQYMSWITIDDLVAAILFAIENKIVSGPVNAVSPHPVTNAEFTEALGRALHRPTLLPVPAFALRLAVGEMADEMLLSSTRAVPTKLTELGFLFSHPDLSTALRHVL
jgi:hypothetical protein